MNAGQAARAETMHGVYKAIYDILSEGYDEWAKMDNHDLMVEVMKRTKGHHNPSLVNTIIQRL